MQMTYFNISLGGLDRQLTSPPQETRLDNKTLEV